MACKQKSAWATTSMTTLPLTLGTVAVTQLMYRGSAVLRGKLGWSFGGYSCVFYIHVAYLHIDSMLEFSWGQRAR